jgi:hypothetical protein
MAGAIIEQQSAGLITAQAVVELQSSILEQERLVLVVMVEVWVSNQVYHKLCWLGEVLPT